MPRDVRIGERVKFVETHWGCDDDDCKCSGCEEVKGTVVKIYECGFCYLLRIGEHVCYASGRSSCCCILKVKQDRTKWIHWIPFMRNHKVYISGVERLGLLDLLAEI